MASRKFTKPPDTQDNSRLAQLPTELRFMILRLLLRHEHKKDISAGIRVYETCQLLFHEAYHVFFTDNILVLKFKLSDYYVNQHMELDCELYGVKWMLDIWHQQLCPILPDEKFTDVASIYGVDLGTSLPHFDRGIALIWEKFQTIKFKLTRNRDEIPSLAQLCRLFKPILSGKHLIIETESNDVFASLDGCKILSCASIMINGTSAPSDVMQHVSGSIKTRDTYREWYELHNIILDKLPKQGGIDFRLPRCYDFMCEFHYELLSIEQIAWRYDSIKYSACIKQVLKNALTWKQDWYLDRISRFEQDIRMSEEAAAQSFETEDEDLIEKFRAGILNDDKRVLEDSRDKSLTWQERCTSTDTTFRTGSDSTLI